MDENYTSSYNAAIVSVLQQKDSEGNYHPFHIGPEQRYVGATRKTNNNNLEEQLLLGIDRIKTSWIEEGIKREKIEFRDNERTDDNGYYILDSYIYLDENDIYTENNSLYIGTPFNNNPMTVRRDILQFKNVNNEIINISQKVTTKTYENNMCVTKEIITQLI